MSQPVVKDPEALSHAVSAMVDDAVFSKRTEVNTVLTPIAEMHYVLGVEALRQAAAQFMLANYHAMRKD